MNANYFDSYSHPMDVLKELSNKWNFSMFSSEFAQELDKSGIWPTYRDRFFYPKCKDLSTVDLNCISNTQDDCIYLCGNSLGLQCKASREKIDVELDKWARTGVFGHFEGDLPWASCEEPGRVLMGNLVGAKKEEICIMNSLSVNLHLMLISFYRPTKERYRVLIEDKAFPSDHYAVESQIKLNGLVPSECMICLKPREGEYTLRTEDILDTIKSEGKSIALVLLSGVQYYTGQLFQIKEITEVAREQGCMVGWDLAHAVGNVDLCLHDWNVDFAVWCSYKYLNSGAGNIAAIFLHERHFDIESKIKLDGWWSHRLHTRFRMDNKMDYAIGASAYALSNAPMLLTSCLMGSLELFNEIGMTKIRQKSKILTGYMEMLLNEKFGQNSDSIKFVSLTPKEPSQRGAQLSLKFNVHVERVHAEMEKHGVVLDYRQPDVLRFAPVALYNTFSEIFKMVTILDKIMKSMHCLSETKN